MLLIPTEEKSPIHSRLKRALSWRELYYYDKETADRAIRFFVKHVRHVKGPLSGELVHLEPWERRIVRRIFGWKKRSNHNRKHRVIFIYLPRKQGKSTLCAGLALYCLHADGELGAEVISAAANREQANIVFSIAKDMNDLDPLLKSRAKSFAQSLVIYETASSYKVISGIAKTKHGENLSAVIFDELHTQKDRELYDVLKTSTASRAQPLEIYATTAGFDENSICYEVYDKAKLVRDGTLEDPTMLPIIYEADPTDDWTKEETWKKANPNYGISVKKEYYEIQVREALQRPAYENSFKRLHLNMWTSSDVRAVNMTKWKECGKIPYSIEALAGKPCWMGVDLSNKNDMTALALLFLIDGIWFPLMRYWCPEETVEERTQRFRLPYDVWAKKGYLTITPGGRIDNRRIRQDINQLAEVYGIGEIAVDPWNAHQLCTELEEEDGFTVVQIRQGTFTLNEPTKEFISLVSEVKFAHGNNPVLTWNAGNLSTEEDAAGNLKPSKKRSQQKIDGCTAIITAFARALVATSDKSVYRERGITAW